MYVVIFSLYTEFFFDSVQKIFAFNFNFLFKFSSFIFVLMPRIDLLCCCGDQFFYLFFKISCWKKTSSFPFYYFFYVKNTQKFVKWGGWKIMPQENIMANARLQTRKKIQGPKIFFCCFNFCSFFLFQKSCNFIYILYFFSVDLQEGYKITNFDDFSF